MTAALDMALAVNGKFLSASPTGVHRVAAELLKACAARLDAQDASQVWEVLKPRDALRTLGLTRAPERIVGSLTWQPWEQIDLPRHARRRPLLSLCNLAPLAHGASVVMMHDAQVFSTPQSYSAKFRSWYRLLQPALGRRALQVLTVSEFSAGELARYGVAEPSNISVVPNGCDHLDAVEADVSVLDRLGLDRRPFVLALANTQAHKNIALLFKAWRDPRLRDLTLVLVGGATAKDFLAAGSSAPDSVLFAGPVSDAQLKGLMQTAVGLAFPSLTEGFGLPPLEAMAAGCPALVAPCGALPEVCGDAALYAPADDPRVWADQLIGLSTDTALRERMVEKGRRRAQAFTWDRSAERLLQILQRL